MRDPPDSRRRGESGLGPHAGKPPLAAAGRPDIPGVDTAVQRGGHRWGMRELGPEPIRLVRACGGSVANSMEACLTSLGLRNVGSPPTWASQRRSDSAYSPYARATRLKTVFEEVLTHDWSHSALTRGEFRGDARRIMFLEKQHVFSESDDVRCRESVSWRALSNHPPKKK